MSFLDKLLGRSKPRNPKTWQPPQEGSTTPPGFRPQGWEVPPKEPGDSEIIMTKGEADGSHVTVRLPESSVRSGGEYKG